MRRSVIAVALVTLLGICGAIVLLNTSRALGDENAPHPRRFPIFASGRDGVPITYQGQLRREPSGEPVDKECSFIFKLFKDEENGTQLGQTVTKAVTLRGGLFTVALDFGDYDHAGLLPWLDIQVKCAGDGEFHTLKPRQQLTAAPIAMALPGLRTENPGDVNATPPSSPNIIGGAFINSVPTLAVTPTGTVTDTGPVIGATIGGGGSMAATPEPNQVTASFGTISGGRGNSVRGMDATIAGGRGNIASGDVAIVLGGQKNEARGAGSLAAGQQARAIRPGSFVWADGVGRPLESSGNNQVIIRANGGIWLGLAVKKDGSEVDTAPTIRDEEVIATSTGAYLSKSGIWEPSRTKRADARDISPVNSLAMLQQVVALPIQAWRDPVDATQRIGPFADDFAATFKLGSPSDRMSPADVEGVTLAAIQGLSQELQARDQRIAQLSDAIKLAQTENATLRHELDDLKTRLSALETRASGVSPTDTWLSSVLPSGGWPWALLFGAWIVGALIRQQRRGERR